ncbi:hypothetical protein ACQ4LE_005832 [Meloidogyne hapla]
MDFEDKCVSCTRVELKKKIYIWRLPEILVISLLRGQPNGEKDCRFIDFPMDNLDLRQFLHPESPDNAFGYQYHLYGIVEHFGEGLQAVLRPNLKPFKAVCGNCWMTKINLN